MRQLKAQGCFVKQAGPYTRKTLLNLALLGAFLAVLVTVRHPVLQILNAAFLGFVFVQIGMVVHDLGHHQVYRLPWQNDVAGILQFNLLLGISYHYWLDNHQKHHRHPNQLDHDPDIDYPLAYSVEQARRARGPHRLLVRYQALLFFPVLSLGLYSLQFLSASFLLCRPPRRYRALEAFTLAGHHALYLGLLAAFLPPAVAVAFFLVHHAATGLYLGVVFATNHMGMPVLDPDARPDFLYLQAVTARDIRAHPVTDYLFGPLSCQIEHHLFPIIPLGKLRAAQSVVRSFCAGRSIPYHETGVAQALGEILRHLHRISQAIR